MAGKAALCARCSDDVDTHGGLLLGSTPNERSRRQLLAKECCAFNYFLIASN